MNQVDYAQVTSKIVLDYDRMDGGTLLTVLRDDASKWAEAFCQFKKKNNWTIDSIDEGLMIVWFANAIENAKSEFRHIMERAVKFPPEMPVPAIKK